MYYIYIDGDLVYTSQYNQAIETGFEAASLSLQINSTQTFEYTVAPNSEYYNKARMLKSLVEVKDGNDLIFFGRPIKEETDFYNNKKITCEGALGFLYDSIQRPKEYTGQTITAIFTDLLSRHNEQVEDYKKIYPGSVTVVDITDNNTYDGSGKHDTDTKDPYEIYQYEDNSDKTGTQTELKTNYETTFDALNNLLVQTLGGYLNLRYEGGRFYLDYLKDYMESEGQVIMFGDNLLDFSTTLDYSNICTGVIPLGKSQKRDDSEDSYQMYTTEDDTEDRKLTVASINNGSDTIWSETGVNNFGRVVKMVEWSNIDDVNKLMEKGKKYLTNTQYDALTLECKVVDLHLVDNFRKPFKLLHLVEVKSIPHDMDKMFPITELNMDLMDPSQNTVTLGATYNTLTGALHGTAQSLSGTERTVSNISNTINNNNSIAWTNITKTNTDITAEANARETSDKNQVTDYSAKFNINAQNITAEVKQRSKADTDLSSSIKQTAKDITAKVDDNAKDLHSEIVQTANSITSTIEDNNNNLKSQIEQTAGSIRTSVQNNAQAISSHWEQTPTSFSLGFNDGKTLSITAQNDSKSKTVVNATVDLDTLLVKGKNISMTAGDVMNLGGGQVIVETEDGFLKKIGDSYYTVVSTKSFYNSSDVFKYGLANNIDLDSDGGNLLDITHRLRLTIRNIVEGYGYLTKTDAESTYKKK